MDSKSEGESSGNFIWGVIAGLLVLGGAGGAYMAGVFDGPKDEASVQADAETKAPAPEEPDVVAVDEPAPDPTPKAPEVKTVAPPALDQIFVERDGNALLSGSAEPGSQLRVVLDGETVHSFIVDDSGQFAEFVTIPFSDAARGLALETEGEEAPARSDDYVIAALPAPEPVIEEEVAASEDTPGETDVLTSDTAEVEAAEDEATPDTSETQQVAVLRSGEDGVELVQAPSEEPEQVALDTIGYSDTGDVELTGRVADGSVVRLYLDNRLVADLPASDDGKWRSQLEGVDPGVYTLRVDEVGSDGTVVSRLETPIKREPIEVLQPAVAENQPQPDAVAPIIRSVTVQEGDTLWAISRDRFGDGLLYVRLFEANKGAIRDPDLIYPGQIFTIPE